MKDQINEQYLKTEFSTFSSEISGDYILPDSFPDVKNILCAQARIYDIKKYFGASEGEISGNIAYSIMFSAQGDDGSDEICSVSFIDDFKTTCRYKNQSNSGVCAHVNLATNTCRMANPRKFSIKSTIETLMFEDVNQNAYPTFSPDTPADSDIQYKWSEAEICRCKTAELTEHSFSDNIELDMKLPEIAQILHYDVGLNVRDERSSDIRDATMKLGGMFTLNLIYKDKENEIHGINRDIPFGISISDDESAMIGDLGQSLTGVVASAYISALNLNIGKNQYDESKVIEFDSDYDIDLLLISNETVKFVTDAYSTEYESECKFETQNIMKPLARIKNNFTYTDTRDKGELSDTDLSILSASIPAFSDIHPEKNGNYISIAGKINEKATFIHEENRLRGKEISLPFVYKSSVNVPKENCTIIGNASLSDNRVRCDGEKVYTDAEIYLDYLLTAKESINVCKSITLGEKKCDCKKELFCVYYPSEDESLWDTAKMKKTTVEKILLVNPLLQSGVSSPIIIE